MAQRTILTIGDETLNKKCRVVTEFNDRLATLLDDMTETLKESGGVGLAAPQIGVLRRVVVILHINKDPEEVIELINPEVIEHNTLEETVEGSSLSVPGNMDMSCVLHGQRFAHRTATATGLNEKERALLHNASVMRASIWTDICLPKR